MKKYRKAVKDPMHNIWILEKRVLWFFWTMLSAEDEKSVDQAVKRLNEEKL